MHKPESVQKYKTHKILWYFAIKMAPPILARRTDLVVIMRKKLRCQLVDFAIPTTPKVRVKEGKNAKYLDLE